MQDKKYAKIYFWSFVERIGPNIISLLGNIILVRLLSPDDFGLMGMVAILSVIAYSFSDAGLSDALLKEREIIEKDYNTVFLYSVVVGLVLMIVFFLIAIPISEFYKRDELVLIVRILGVNVFIIALSTVQLTKLRKLYKNSLLATMCLIANFLSMLIAITIAYYRRDYVALVVQQLIYACAIAILTLLLTNWRPKIEFDVAKFRFFWKFSFNLLIVYITTNIGRNINSIILGKFFPLNMVGYYAQSLKLRDTVSGSLESAFVVTSYVVISNANSLEEKRRKIVSLWQFYSLIILSVLSFLFVEAHDILGVIFGKKWLPCVPFFRILILILSLTSLNAFIGTILKSENKTNVIRNMTLSENIGFVIIALLFYQQGIMFILSLNLVLAICIFIAYLIILSKLNVINIGKIITTYVYVVLFLLLPVLSAYLTGKYLFTSGIFSLLFSGIAYLLLLIVLGECTKFKPYCKIKGSLIPSRKAANNKLY